MNPKLKKFLPLIIGAAIAVLIFILLITGIGETMLKGLLGLLGIGAGWAAVRTVTNSREVITESTKEHAETTEALNANQAERSEADAVAVREAAADPGPDTTVPEDDERERLRAEMAGAKWGKPT